LSGRPVPQHSRVPWRVIPHRIPTHDQRARRARGLWAVGPRRQLS